MRKDRGFKEREAAARLECERDGIDPDAPYVDRRGNRTEVGDGRYFLNHDYYDLVLGGFADRPVKKGFVH